MEIKLGFIPTENQLDIMTLDTTNQEMTSERIDTTLLNNVDLNLIVFNHELNSQLDTHKKFVPMATFEQLESLGQNSEDRNFDNMLEIYNTIANSWVLKNNLNTIENMVSTTRYLRGLLISDRNSFFEELWYLIKTNLNCSELSLIFHDLKQEVNKEKEVKPSLCHSVVKGKRVPNLQAGTNIEESLMKNYEADFSAPLNITDYSREKQQLVACAKIDLSPILIMARISEMSALQESILQGLFKGLQKD